MIIAIRRALGLPWLGWRKARLVRKQLVALKLKMDTRCYSDYDYVSTLMCCTEEGGEIISIIGISNMRRMNGLFNADIIEKDTLPGVPLSAAGCINYPVDARYTYLFGRYVSETRQEAARYQRKAEIRKQLLNFWCKTLLGEEI